MEKRLKIKAMFQGILDPVLPKRKKLLSIRSVRSIKAVLFEAMTCKPWQIPSENNDWDDYHAYRKLQRHQRLYGSLQTNLESIEAQSLPFQHASRQPNTAWTVGILPPNWVYTTSKQCPVSPAGTMSTESPSPAHCPLTPTVSRQSTSTTGNNTMYPFWLIFGIVTILAGIFNRQMLRLLGFKPMSEVLTIPNLKHSSRIIEEIGRWLVITLGASFFVQGLGGALPNDVTYKISLSLLGLSGLMILTIIGITIANWKAK